ncbi:MAG: succinate dehydrogenase, hydrophobic membrane anchor protein [Methylomonas sp.]
MDDKTALSKTADIFSVKSPVGHWLYQRMTAAALVPLSIWLILLLNKAQHAAYPEMVAWLSSPINVVAIFAWILVAFFHAALGMQVVIEDYVSTLSIRNLAIRVANLIFLIFCLAALTAMAFIFSTR